jgi:ubiquinone/menaquinone biosynthesis C-methylase UbiE
MDEVKIKEIVRKNYAKIAKKRSSCCSSSCCQGTVGREKSYKRLGYPKEELRSLPEGVFSLGCGNPVALASLKEGEVVLDLGSGSGLDCFLASKRVGDSGRVIGVDMTPEMIDAARENARKGNYKNVEFRLGEIENLPVADGSVDVVISNCVINLSPNKNRVFEEAFRVLKPGGRLIISDLVLLSELPPAIKENADAYVSCISGAVKKEEYLNLIKQAGFQDVKVIEETIFPLENIISDPEAKNLKIASIKVYGVKPSNQRLC